MINSGGVLRFELGRGVPLKNQNPYPSLRVILAEKGTHFQGFFLKNRPILQEFCNLWGFCHAKFENLGSVRKVDTCLRIFFVKNGAHVQGFLVKKRPIRAAHPRSAKYVNTPPGDKFLQRGSVNFKMILIWHIEQLCSKQSNETVK